MVQCRYPLGGRGYTKELLTDETSPSLQLARGVSSSQTRFLPQQETRTTRAGMPAKPKAYKRMSARCSALKVGIGVELMSCGTSLQASGSGNE